MKKLLRLAIGARADFSMRVELMDMLNQRLWRRTEGLLACYRSCRTRKLRCQSLIAVTGSLGKTTATRALMCALNRQTPAWIHEADNCFALVGLNMLRQCFQPYAIVEVGIGNVGQMERYARMLQPDIVVLTALGTDHSRNFGDTGKLWQEKLRLVQSLRPGGVAVLNGDDENVLRLAKASGGIKTITYGFSANCDVHARDVEVTPNGTSFTLAGRRIQTRLIGSESVRALLVAIAVGRHAGISLDTLLERLATLTPTPGRMQPMSLVNGAVAICDDFKASVETVRASLAVFAQMQAGRRIVVLGEIFHPPRPRIAKYQDIAKLAAETVGRIILIGKRAQLYKRGLGDIPVSSANTVEEAAALLRAELQAGDAVLIKGRGEHKLSRIALMLAGRNVQCRLAFCKYENVLCSVCPKL
ncbi:MAG: hypothetical protein LBH01_08520 [Verrucomicrobiales bacterium]|jgi:UDP-N-acetylmuramoyl-tripeptide--D-alanyl-D-alanine ligase|nr:hypothetical protein [Verrucomicrobiales bacterium]